MSRKFAILMIFTIMLFGANTLFSVQANTPTSTDHQSQKARGKLLAYIAGGEQFGGVLLIDIDNNTTRTIATPVAEMRERLIKKDRATGYQGKYRAGFSKSLIFLVERRELCRFSEQNIALSGRRQGSQS